MIRRQVVIPAEPARVWEALTDPGQAAAWLGGRIEWEVREGAPLRFVDDDGRGRDGRVEAVRPGRYLRYTWWGAPRPGQDAGRPASGATVEPDDPDPSEVSYLLEPDGDGTRLTIQERSVPAGGPQASAARGAAAPAWTPWDSRLAGAWTCLAARPHAGARA